MSLCLATVWADTLKPCCRCSPVGMSSSRPWSNSNHGLPKALSHGEGRECPLRAQSLDEGKIATPDLFLEVVCATPRNDYSQRSVGRHVEPHAAVDARALRI